MNKEYNNIISFGCMCSTAIHLNKLGVRSSSSFFDWLTSEIKSNISLVDNGFRDVFNPSYFKQEYAGFPHLITNTKYNFVYTHVFNPKRTLKRQIRSVSKKVMKTVENFRKALADGPTLLIYYCRDEGENDWIMQNEMLIKDFADRQKCDIMFIFNHPCVSNFSFPYFVIPQNDVHKPIGGGVSYPFVMTQAIDDYLLPRYSEAKRRKNLAFKPKKHLAKRAIDRIFSSKKDRLVIEK